MHDEIAAVEDRFKVLAQLDDTVLRTVTDIVTPTLGHVDVIAKHAAPHEQAIGCCLTQTLRALARCEEAAR